MNVSAEQFARALGLIIGNTSVYGAAHAVTQQSLESCFQLLTQIWASDDVCLNVTESGLNVNQDTVELKNMLIQGLAEHLEEREITNFTLKKGTTRAQFSTFVEVLTAEPQELQQLGGFAGAVGAVGLDGAVGARKVVYRAITEDEHVVDKTTLTQLGNDRQPDHGAVQSVIDFLNSEGAVNVEDAARSVMTVGADTDQLADLILNAAEVRTADPSAKHDETLWELVAGFLRRTVDAMTRDPASRTQAGRKNPAHPGSA